MADWRDFAPKTTTRQREDIEWTIRYEFNATDLTSPRVLLIGDSICYGYHDAVRLALDGKVNVSFWASSRCVTDKDYFRELDFVLSLMPCDLVCFNNGLHSKTTDRAEWIAAYQRAVSFIQAQMPRALVSLTTSTPTRLEDITGISSELNQTVFRVAKERNFPVIDLFELMNPLDRQTYWRDDYHFTSAAIEMQAEFIADHVLSRLSDKLGSKVAHAATETGPDGSID